MSARQQEAERTCIVTRRSLAVDGLLRFVVAPDGAVVPDFRRRLPGRGIWVTADAEHVALAEKRKLFARAHGGPVKVEPDLAGRVGQGLGAAAVAALSMARKAGEAVSGFVKVEAALRRGGVIGLIHAAEASPDGVAKVSALARAQQGVRDVAIIRVFTSEQLDLAFGRPNVIHAALLGGPAGRNLLVRVKSWLAYRGGESTENPVARPPIELQEPTETLSPGQRNE